MHSSNSSQSRTCIVGQPRTYTVASTVAREPAYRRLAIAILRLDVATLAVELRSARVAVAHADSSAQHVRTVRAA